MLSTVVVSAPGKVILHGEHSVVYGKKAIACALDLRTTLSLQSIPEKSLVLKLSSLEIDATVPLDGLPVALASPACDGGTELSSELHNAVQKMISDTPTLKEIAGPGQQALETILYMYVALVANNKGFTSQGLRLEVTSTLPVGAGLGSSAAFSVCVVASFLLATKQITGPLGKESPATLKKVNEWAYLAECIIHGRPSGIDNTISCFGGAITRNQSDFHPLEKFVDQRVLLVHTKVPRSTKALVAGVRDLYNQQRVATEAKLDEMDQIAHEAEKIYSEYALVLENGSDDAEQHAVFDAKVKELVTRNQTLLEDIGVSHPTLKQICDIATSHSLAAKLTGAGGGGCAVVFIPSSTTKQIIEAITQELSVPFKVWDTRLGGRGVAIDDISE
eukprot:m.113497 g.113497  ORF g.113497 m.113497 type:complete len:390 (-) comp13516_c0_seq4:183-1352(-)